MSDLIRRDDVVKAMNEALAVGDISRAIANDILNDIPSAAPERKKGEWIDGNGIDTFIHCSVCYEEAYWDSDYGQQKFDFCPHCGADMRGE